MIKKIAFICAALLGIFIFLFLFEDTFPTASIDLKITRDDAIQKARIYVKDLGYSLEGYETSVVFSGDSTKFVFLEKCLGLKKASHIAKDTIPIWSWKVRFFRELEKEEFTVLVNPNGRIDSFIHDTAQNAPGKTITQDAARTQIEDFFKGKNVSIETMELIESKSVQLENRTDHTFVWKNTATELEWREKDQEGQGMLRLSATVQGDKIGEFQSYFWTPEVFDRFIRKLSSEGRFLALVSSFFYMLLYIAAIVMFIASFRDVPLPARLMLSLALLIGIPNFLNLFNSLPILKAGYDTKVNFLVYYGSEIIYGLKGIINNIIVIIIVFCGGTYLARKLYKDRIVGFHSVLEGKRVTPAIRNEIYGGYIFAAIALGFVTLFYYLGMKYCGVWVFPSVQYSNILGTAFPFLLPLSLSIVAAVSEEFIFRMFAISFLKRYLRVTFLAVIIPALIWAFAHSSYAVFPIYTRGIELTIVACAFSYVFLRYGILNCIVAHYVIDAVLFSIPLLRSSNLYFIISGVIVILLALVPAFYGFCMRSVAESEKS
jgi:hypothetical protein